MGKRLVGLDALRGLAALAVVLHHYTARYPEVTKNPLEVSFSLPDGNYGVQLFFIISGFVIFMTLERTPRLSDFVGSRVARLWPAFLACLALTTVVLLVFRPGWGPPISVRSVLANATMAPDLLRVKPIDGSYWSLLYELLFYAFAAAGYFALGARSTEWLCLGWLAAAIGARVISKIFGLSALPWRLEMMGALRYAPLFVMGIMIYRIRHRQAGWSAAFLILLSLAMCGFGPEYSIRPIPRWAYVGLMAGFGLLVWTASREASPLARARLLVFLGDISYPLYLLHQVLGYVILEELTGWGWGANAALATAILLVILLAFGISRGVEKPGQRMVRALLAGEKARPVPVPAGSQG